MSGDHNNNIAATNAASCEARLITRTIEELQNRYDKLSSEITSRLNYAAENNGNDRYVDEYPHGNLRKFTDLIIDKITIEAALDAATAMRKENAANIEALISIERGLA